MWPDHHGPGKPDRPPQSLTRFDYARYSSPRMYSPSSLASADSSYCFDRSRAVRSPLRLPFGIATTGPSPESRVVHPSTGPITDPSVPALMSKSVAEVFLVPVKKQQKRLAGSDLHAYPSPPFSHGARSSPPSPTNVPPVVSDTDPICPLFAADESPSATLMRLTPEKFEELVETMTGRITFPGISSAMFDAWQSLYPEVREADHLNYEYDSRTCRFMIKCATSPVHESVSIFFTNRVSAALQSRLGIDTYEDTVQVSSGMTFDSFQGSSYRSNTQKIPDAYLRVIGDDFPSVVCETGWSESLENLREDAKLWLLGSRGLTRVVVVVSFQESNPAEVAAIPPPGDESPDGVDHPTAIEGGPVIEDGPADDSDPDESNPDEFPEEQDILGAISATTKYLDLADSLLDLHRRGRLAKPLLGTVTAILHLFRLNAAGDDIEETFTAAVLPASVEAPAEFSLTLTDLLGPLVTATNNLNPDEEVLFPLTRLRKVISDQIPPQEKRRSRARAEALMKEFGVWDEEMPTFAQMKRMKRKRE